MPFTTSVLSSRHGLIVRILGGIIAGLLFCAVASAAGVSQFAPQGQIDQQIRATAVFSEDMVPLGRAGAPAPC